MAGKAIQGRDRGGQARRRRYQALWGRATERTLPVQVGPTGRRVVASDAAGVLAAGEGSFALLADGPTVANAGRCRIACDTGSNDLTDI